jgi:hypothetical protein
MRSSRSRDEVGRRVATPVEAAKLFGFPARVKTWRSLPLPRCLRWHDYDEVPPVETSLRVVAEAALDRGFSLGMNYLTELPPPAQVRRARAEAAAMAAFMADGGFHENPATYHRTPHPPGRARLRPARACSAGGPPTISRSRCRASTSPTPASPVPSAGSSIRATTRCTHSSSSTGTGRARGWWACTASAWARRSPTSRSSSPSGLHHELGWNVILPSLPLHGRRE